MKKYGLLVLVASVFLLTGFLHYKRGVIGDLYYSETRTNIQLKIDKSLRYLGEIDYLNGQLKAHAFIWLTPDPSGPGINKMFIIEHTTVDESVSHRISKKLFRGIPSFKTGSTVIGGDPYQYAFYITEPKGRNFWTDFIKEKGFVLNQPKLTGCFGRVSTDTAWTKFYYFESYDPETFFRESLGPEDAVRLEQFQQHIKRDIVYRGKYK